MLPMALPLKKLIVIAGPTAVGKTTVAIKIAQFFNTEIISADSRQCYKELNIGVARPDAAELAAVPHHFIASHSINQTVNAAVFEAYAVQKLAEIFKQRDIAVLCGGTGLYIQALCFGLDAVPDISETLRQQLRSQYAEKGLAWLQEVVKTEDAAFYSGADINNPHRLLRALEVVRFTGQSILHYQKNTTQPRHFTPLFFNLQLSRSELYQRIDARVEAMIKNGLIEEVKGLQPYKHLSPLNTVGYKELFPYLDGPESLPQAIEKIKRNSRQYAKRQQTWFNNRTFYTPVAPQFEAVKQHILSGL